MSKQNPERQLTKLVWIISCLLLLSGAGPIYAEPEYDKPAGLPSSIERLYFIENRGQLDPAVSYYLSGRNKTLYFTQTGVTIALTESEANNLARWVVKLDFVGGRAQPTGQAQTETVVSYFQGAPEAWQVGLPTYDRLEYADLWPGIDLVYTIQDNQLKYHFTLQPGADPAHIQLAYRGATAVTLTPTGRLKVTTPAGNFFDAAPTAYQLIDGQRQHVTAAYGPVVHNRDTATYGFDLGDYNPAPTDSGPGGYCLCRFYRRITARKRLQYRRRQQRLRLRNR